MGEYGCRSALVATPGSSLMTRAVSSFASEVVSVMVILGFVEGASCSRR